MSVTFETIEYENYGKCVKISNGIVDAIVTAEIGPRVLFYGFTGGENMFHLDINRETLWEGKEFDDYYFKGSVSYLYGGHRIWVTPEYAPQTYYPDNYPLDIEYKKNGAVFTAPPQVENNIRVSLEIEMDDNAPHVNVYNRVQNIGSTDKEYAVWTVNVMKHGGLEIVKHNSNDTGYLHNRVLSMWQYTNPNDYRFYNGKKYITVKQDPSAKAAFKIGYNNRSGIVLYAGDSTVFAEQYTPDHDNAAYPDGNVSFETYTSDKVLELETLDKIRTVKPNEISEYKESWTLFENPGTPDAHSDDEIDKFYNDIVSRLQ